MSLRKSSLTSALCYPISLEDCSSHYRNRGIIELCGTLRNKMCILLYLRTDWID